MAKKDIMELKRRLKKEECTFTRMCGCYVNSQKEIVLTFGETFLNLKEDEFYKYLDISAKVLSGTFGNNILELPFISEEEATGGKQQFYLGLRESKLKNDELLMRFYEQIIAGYSYPGNYLILIYHDAYDVITRTTDHMKLDESEEVFEYLLCAICPVALSKPGLGYRKDENRIAARIRDWVVEVPDVGFVFPAFSERSSDIHSVLYYTKDAKNTDERFMESLGCVSKMTATEQRETFHSIVKTTLLEENVENRDELLLTIQENLNDVIEDYELTHEKDAEPIVLSETILKNIMEETGLNERVTNKISNSCNEEFGTDYPVADKLIDSKALHTIEQQKREKELRREVETLKQQLETLPSSIPTDEPLSNEEIDVVLNVKPEKINQIKTTVIDGQKCIVIPLSDEEKATVNGQPPHGLS